MIVVVADASDGATSVAQHLRASHEIIVLTPHDLAVAQWKHEVDRRAQTRTTLQTPRVRVDARAIRALWCNAAAVPCLRFSNQEDREYGSMELQAIVASWLHSLGRRVANATDGQTLIGPSWSRFRWLQAAHNAGLETSTDPTTHSVLVAGSSVVGDLDPAASAKLVTGARCRLLEVFCTAAGRVTGVSPRVEINSEERLLAAVELLSSIASGHA